MASRRTSMASRKMSTVTGPTPSDLFRDDVTAHDGRNKRVDGPQQMRRFSVVEPRGRTVRPLYSRDARKNSILPVTGASRPISTISSGGRKKSILADVDDRPSSQSSSDAGNSRPGSKNRMSESNRKESILKTGSYWNEDSYFSERNEQGLERTIKDHDNLIHLMTACGLLLILFSVVIPVCTIVLSILQGAQPLQIPGYLSPIVFICLIICVFLARSSSKKINKLVLFISMIILSVFGILLSLGLMVVGIIVLNNDSPAPFGQGNSVHPQLMDILAMECALVSAGVVTLVVTCILLGIGIHFTRGVYAHYSVSSRNKRPSSSRTMTPAIVDLPSEEVKPRPETRKKSVGFAMSSLGNLDQNPEPDVYIPPKTAPNKRRVSAVEEPRGRAHSLSHIMFESDDPQDPDDVLQLPDTAERQRLDSTRRWGKAKNVMRAIMDVKHVKGGQR